MSNYRPITDFWLLGRAKRANGIKRYGAYLGGFPERARKLLGVPVNVPILHACGGLARYYPYRGGFGPNDKTLDLALPYRRTLSRMLGNRGPCLMAGRGRRF